MEDKFLINYVENNHFLALLKQKQAQCSSNKTILFIEPYGAVLSLLKHGVQKGFNIIILTANTDLRIVSPSILQAAALSICINTANETVVLQVVKDLSEVFHVDAVIPGFEYFVPIAAKISEYFKLPGLHVEEVMKLRRKDLMRLALSKSGIATPKFMVIHSIAQLEHAINQIGFPAVCKPVDAAGSVNVKKVTNANEALEAARRILQGNDVLWGHALAKALLYEEYIDGKEYSVEGVVQQGEVLHFGMTEKFVSDQLEFIEIGHIVNPPLEKNLKEAIQKYINQVIHVLHADHCPFHAEVRINEEGHPVLMEIAARLAGDKIGDLINLTQSENYFDAVYAAYLGEKTNIYSSHRLHAGIRFFYRPNVNTYSSIAGIEEAQSFPIEEINFYYSEGQSIPVFPKPLRRLGHVVMKTNDYDQLVRVLEEVDRGIHFICDVPS